MKTAKVVKRIVVISLSVVLALVLVLISAPIIFKKQIMEFAKTELNKMLAAKVDFKDLKLSFIRNFPNAYVALEGLEINGVDDFEGELLVAFEKFSVTANLMSVIRMKNMEIKSVLLDRARLNGHILEDGRANWNIIKPGEEKDAEIEKEKPETGDDPFKFRVGLQRFEIRNMEISFLDEQQKMSAEVQALNYTLRGDMRKTDVDLKMELGIDGIDFWMGEVRMANKANVEFVSEIAADLKNMDFVLKDNKFNLNDITLKFNGSAGIKEDDINVDLAFATEKTDFKSLLSLVPVIYMNDFKDLKTTGSLALSGGIKGTYNEKTMPSADLDLSVTHAAFSYPDLPKSVEKINITVKAHYDGEVFDRTTLDIDKFGFEIAGNPFNAEFHVKTPESDMQLAARFAGKIDIDSVADIVPLDDVVLNGLLECDLSLAGRLSTLQQERYEDFQAAGSLKLSGFNYKNPDFPQGAKINTMQLNFTPRKVDLANFDAVTGRTDIAMNGSLENFIPFVLKKETVRGTLALTSNTIDLNELMGDKPAEEKPAVPEDTAPLSVIEVPQNIDFTMTVNIGTILFDKLVLTRTSGAVLVKDGKLTMRNLGLNLLEGSMTLNGEYNTQNKEVPLIDLGVNAQRLDISTALASFSTLEKLLPQPQNYAGKVSATLNLYGALDEHLSPVLDTVVSKGRIQTQNLEIRNSKIFGALADFSKNEKWRTPAPGNLNIGYQIKDGRLWLEDPIVINIAPAKLELKGDQGLDMSLNYRIDATMPTSTIGAGATDLLNKLPAGLSVKEIKISGLVKGTAKEPQVSLGLADMAGSITETVKETVTQKIEEVKTQVNEEVNRQINQIMAEAEKQADTLRNTAKQSAERAVREANAAADRLVSNAADKSALEKRLAQASADKLRSEGEASAKKLELEAENQAKAVLAAAQKKADELKR